MGPFGPLTGLTFGNSLVLTRTLDQQYRLTDQTTGKIQDLDFTLDAAGNVDAITDWVNTSLSQRVQAGCAQSYRLGVGRLWHEEL
jgi:hypothetical protein